MLHSYQTHKLIKTTIKTQFNKLYTLTCITPYRVLKSKHYKKIVY